jgi:hypothetical protein
MSHPRRCPLRRLRGRGARLPSPRFDFHFDLHSVSAQREWERGVCSIPLRGGLGWGHEVES